MSTELLTVDLPCFQDSTPKDTMPVPKKGPDPSDNFGSGLAQNSVGGQSTTLIFEPILLDLLFGSII